MSEAPQDPPPSEQPAVPDAAGTTEEPGTPPTKDEQTMALIAHLLGIFTSFIGCLIIWLVKKDESEFIADQAKEALNFQITVLIIYVIGVATTCIMIGFLICLAAIILSVVFSIIGGIKANDGVKYRYPFALRMIK